MEFGDDHFLVDLDTETEPQLVVSGHRRTSANEQHMQHANAGFPMGGPLPQPGAIPGAHQFVSPDAKLGQHSPGGQSSCPCCISRYPPTVPYGQQAMPFGAIMPTTSDPATWRAGTATPDSPGLPFQGLSLQVGSVVGGCLACRRRQKPAQCGHRLAPQSPAHSTGIGGASPFEAANGDGMGGMVQPAPGMMMTSPLHTVRMQCTQLFHADCAKAVPALCGALHMLAHCLCSHLGTKWYRGRLAM